MSSSKVVSNCLKKLVDVCQQNQIVFFEECKVQLSLSNIQYGPLGTFLKKNIFNEWFCTFQNNNTVTVYPSELLNPRKCSFSLGIERSSKLLLQNIIEKHHNTLSVFKNALPFGFAVYSTCLKEDCTSTGLRNSFLGDLEAWSRLSVIFFYPRKKPMNRLYYWSKQRYLWWRKYSSVPSDFSMSEIRATPSGDHQLSLLMAFPWTATCPVETVTLHSDEWVAGVVGDRLGPHPPAVVSCEMELDLAVAAYLANSFHESWREGDNKRVFRLHPRLAPYQVCVCAPGLTGDVVDHLQKELKRDGVRVLPSPLLPEEDSFERLDEMGVLYTASLREDTLQSGIAELRHRDTTLMEQVHITELSKKLAQYLKL